VVFLSQPALFFFLIKPPPPPPPPVSHRERAVNEWERAVFQKLYGVVTWTGGKTPGRGHKTPAQCIAQSLIRKGIEATEWEETTVHKEKWRSRIRDIADGACVRITGKARKIVATWVQCPTPLIGHQILKQFTGGK
jgi:hypothetical protein